jgi:1,4-dihydroxy-2-naphthoyl-CoA hydrolase
MITPAQQSILDDITQRWDGTGELLADRMGIEISDPDPNHLIATMPVATNRQPYGLLHGGASAVLAETAGSIAAALHAGPDSIAVGIELTCTHHRSATEGRVTAVCTPLHVGRTISSFEIVISDESDRRICTARLTCAIRPAHRAGLPN